MKTLRLRFAEDTERATTLACETLKRGEVVALPTETVYGLAADAANGEAVARIFQAKERPIFDPLIVHLPHLDFLEKVTRLSPHLHRRVHALVSQFWPGPLSLVLPSRDYVADLVTADLPTVAVRMSAQPIFQNIIGAYGQPLAAPSANRFGRISPTTADHVLEELEGKIPLVIDGGPTLHGLESTILLVGEQDLQILRHGPITAEALGISETNVPESRAKPIAPGQILSHYAPGTPVVLQEIGKPVSGQRCGLVAWEGKHSSDFEAVQWLSKSGDLIEAAAHLFAALRDLDALGLDLIVAERVPARGIGLAILERLTRASASRGLEI